jgi:hypothetical protein
MLRPRRGSVKRSSTPLHERIEETSAVTEALEVIRGSLAAEDA